MLDDRQQESLNKAVPDLQNRLRRIEGQARGIQRMLEERRGCQDIVTQVAALKAAIEQVGVTLVGCLMEGAIRQAVEQGIDSDDAVDKAKKLLSKL